MGKAPSKRKSGTADPETKVLPPIIKLMTGRYPGRMDQFELWVKLGFPENGSLSLGQLDQLKTCLEACSMQKSMQQCLKVNRKRIIYSRVTGRHIVCGEKKQKEKRKVD